MNRKVEYGTSLMATANDIAFALDVMNQAGFAITAPAAVDMRAVACQVLGIDSENEVEGLVTTLAKALDDASAFRVKHEASPFGATGGVLAIEPAPGHKVIIGSTAKGMSRYPG